MFSISNIPSSSSVQVVNNNAKVSFGCANVPSQGDVFQKTDIDVKIGFFKDKLSGNIENMPFELAHKSGIFKTSLEGSVNGMPINAKYDEGILSDSVKGAIGNNELKLSISDGFSGMKIKGTYAGKPVKLKLKDTLTGYKLVGDNTELKIKGKNIFSNDLTISGRYSENKELLPIILDIINYHNQS